MSSDPAAGACLVGLPLAGKTLGGEPCSLDVQAGGTAYRFSSPTLTFDYVSTPRTIFVYDHSVVSTLHQIAWKVDDPISTGVSHELDLIGRFGDAVPAADRRIKIEAAEVKDSGRTTVACTIPL